jgi:DNA-binding PadR family transcriptional regulator
MSKKDTAQRDKRSRADLELFTLALVERSVNSAYLLLSAGLSQGGAIPVLRRLESSGFVRRGKPGPRGRTEFVITAAGRRHLQAGWQPLLEATIPRDIESVLRTANLAVLSGASRKVVSAYLKSAANTKAVELNRREVEIDEAKAALSDNSDVNLYRWMIAMHSTTRLGAEAKFLRKLAAALPKASDSKHRSL